MNGFTEETTFYGENHVETDFEVLRVSFVGKAIEGSLSGENVLIGSSFPGRVSSQNIKISSSFTANLFLKTVTVLPKDEHRFTFKPASSPKTVIKFGNNTIGKLYFDPYKSCGPLKNCYTGLETSKEGKLYFGTDVKDIHLEPEFAFDSGNTKKQINSFDLVGHLWLLGLALHPDTGYIDKELHKLLYSRWTSLLPYER